MNSDFPLKYKIMIPFSRPTHLVSLCHLKSYCFVHGRRIATSSNRLSTIRRRRPSSSTVVFLLSTATSFFTTSYAFGGLVGGPTFPFITQASALTTAESARRTDPIYNSHSSQSSCNSLQMSSTKSTDTSNMSRAVIETGYLNASDAYDLDQQLFSTGYTLEQLMELAGLAVAEAIYDVSPPLPLLSTQISESGIDKKKRVLVICGPGNNGGDGLVAARHLVMFGYDVVVVYPKRSSREPHYSKLVKQCEDVGVQILDTIPMDESEASNQDSKNSIKFDIIVDAIFGFSFKGEAREPFLSIIKKMIEMQLHQKIPIIAVDVPSGWNVDEGDVANTGMVPDILVSLTAPKLCSKEFKGRHFVGGRFLPPSIAEKYDIQMPPYPGVRQVMEINSNGGTLSVNNEEDWAEQYAAYCAEKEAIELNSDKNTSHESIQKQNSDEAEDDWALQYQNYCIEKEARLKEPDEAEERKIQRSDGTDDWEQECARYLQEKEKSIIDENEK